MIENHGMVELTLLNELPAFFVFHAGVFGSFWLFLYGFIFVDLFKKTLVDNMEGDIFYLREI